MAEKTLYVNLERYNGTIENNFRSNWGSLLTYLDSDDTNLLCNTSNKVRFEEQGVSGNNMTIPPIIRQQLSKDSDSVSGI